MGVFIEESEMRFGEYNEANVFNIEKSPQYDLIRPHGVACCEFVLLRSDKLFLIEAKESCPRAARSNCPEENEQENTVNVDDFVLRITKKTNLILLTEKFDVAKYGKEIEINELFPRKTNVSNTIILLSFLTTQHLSLLVLYYRINESYVV